MYDGLLNAMLEIGYDFSHDQDVFWKLGMFGFETAKKVLAVIDPDDGAPVFSTAENYHTELVKCLLAQGGSPNMSFLLSSGHVTTRLT